MGNKSNLPIFVNELALTSQNLQVGKIDEIFGTLRDFFVSVKLSEEVKATSFKKGQQLFIDPAKMLPLARFMPGGDGKFT